MKALTLTLYVIGCTVFLAARYARKEVVSTATNATGCHVNMHRTNISMVRNANTCPDGSLLAHDMYIPNASATMAKTIRAARPIRLSRPPPRRKLTQKARRHDALAKRMKYDTRCSTIHASVYVWSDVAILNTAEAIIHSSSSMTITDMKMLDLTFDRNM